MKALLICPADRAGVVRLAEPTPLAIAPLLGKSALEYWLETLAAQGATHVLVLASDRPGMIRTFVGDGKRWGLRVELLSQNRELTAAEARAKYRPNDATGWLPENDAVVLDHLPGQPDLPLFDTYAGWFAAVQAWMPRALTPPRVGVREIRPGVWVGLRTQLAAGVQLHAPCWLGENVQVSADAQIGPNAVVEDRVVIESGARIRDSIVAPETFVGRFVSVTSSLAQGSLLIDWRSDSCLRVPDAFLLATLDPARTAARQGGAIGRLLALVAMLATSPIATAVMLIALLRGESPLKLRIAVRPKSNFREHAQDTFAYYELTGAGNWLRRWPQFWSVVRGDLAWVGNRPLRPTQAFTLANDFERLWLAVPPGLISLADACGCREGLSPEACAHASFYAANPSRRLDAKIVARALVRAALAWPLYWHQRREQAAALPQLVPKQQG
ncbi:MAG TPA: sugar transferase [Opitutaceae bacterium]|nr:sugar transferase [Opitutaceae bacterium]